MLKTFTIRLYPSRIQTARLERYLLVGRTCYNLALENRIQHYKNTGRQIGLYDQIRGLTPKRAVSPFWSDVPIRVQRDALRRLDKAFNGFFRRLKTGEKPGFPRFKSHVRWNSFTIHECRNVVRGTRIRVSGVGGLIRARNLRQFDGEIIEQCIIRKAGKWFCRLIVDEHASNMPALPKSPIGIDVGLKVFATLSDGGVINNPRFGKWASRALARAHRNLSRAKRGSKNRRKRIAKLQRVYFRLQNLRHNFIHQQSRRVVDNYGVIAVENLNVRGMVQGRLAKGILDACWSQFIAQLDYKAESAGGIVVRVNPSGTSQECSQCGEAVRKDLSVRVHRCNCGCVLDRDLNAARNILKRALDQHRPAVGGIVMPAEGKIASPLKQEVLN